MLEPADRQQLDGWLQTIVSDLQTRRTQLAAGILTVDMLLESMLDAESYIDSVRALTDRIGGGDNDRL